MTAIDAAIIELEAHREHIGTFIRELRRLARVIEDAHAQPAAEVQPAPAQTTATTNVAPGVFVQASPIDSGSVSSGVQAKGSSHDALVMQALRKALDANRDPVSYAEIGTPSRLTKDEVRQALARLVEAKRVVKTGKTNATRFALAPHPPRPGAVAGTPAATPVGPPPANGSRQRSEAQPSDFDVAWNGSKERSGQAPSILPPREQRR